MIDSTKNLNLLPPFQLFTHHPENKLIYDGVYHNGFHSLQQAEIQNNTNDTLQVELSSTLNEQLVFQLTNENLEESDISKYPTNTSNTPLNFSSFNQLFNYVNHINKLTLNPRQKLNFIIGFLPNMSDDNNESSLSLFDHITGVLSLKSSNYTLHVDVHASVCRSVLAVDEYDQDIIFDDCIVGEIYMRDITVRNLSAIDLYWQLNTSDLTLHHANLLNNSTYIDSSNTNNRNDWLKFVDLDMYNQSLDQMKPIPPFSCYLFRVLFTPKEAGTFHYDLQIENINDVNNTIQTKIHATTRNFMHREILFVDTGNLLDFGDCISGLSSKQQITLKNISESPIELHLSAEGADIAFNIKITQEEERLYSQRKNDLSILMSPELSPSDRNKSDMLGNVSPSSDISLLRPLSPATSSKTYNSSTNSAPSTDFDIDMLYNLNELYLKDNLVHGKTLPLLQKSVYSDEESTTKIEDIVLKAGGEKTIIVSYFPEKDNPNSLYAGQFKKRSNFHIIMEYRPYRSTQTKETKIIQCKARTCTSFIHVTPQHIDFGDTNVGTQKTCPIQITNLSDMSAHAELVFESKVLSCSQGEMFIRPRETIEFKLDIFPRKINPSYNRQIKLVNYLNHDNDQIIEVTSNNTDKERVTFHSLFYQIVTPSGANFLDFGQVALHSPAVRTCTIINTREAPLLLGMSSPEEISIYTKKKKYNPRKLSSATTSSSSIQQLEEEIEPASLKTTDTLVAMNHRTKMTNVQYTSTAYLDLATVPYVGHLSQQRKQKIRELKKGQQIKKETTTHAAVIEPQKKRVKKSQQKHYIGITCRTIKRKKKNINWPDIAGKTRVPLDDLISIVENGSLTRTPLFASPAAEEQFVKYQVAWRTELDRLIEKEELVLTTLMQLDPNKEEDIVVVYTPRNEDSQSLTTKKAAAISFQLIDFDQLAIDNDSFKPVLRKMIVRAQVIKSSMEICQRNINFGVVERGERHHKSIILQNKSETPLLYSIKKSGSIASGDIHLDAGRHGVVRAFGKREIEFVFIPTLPGPFVEQLVVLNIRDKEDATTISLKAMVRRPESFHVKTSAEQLVVGPYCLERTSTLTETVVVTNTHKQSKTFEIQIDSTKLVLFQVGFSIEFQTTKELPEELEEKIEALEQKLKIAVTKNKSDKIKKYTRKLAKLRQMGSISGSREDEDSFTTEEADEDEEEVVATALTILNEEERKMSQFSKIVDSQTLMFTLGPSMSSQITISFASIQKQEVIHNKPDGRILVYEHKNMDTCKSFPFSITLCTDHQSCLATLL